MTLEELLNHFDGVRSSGKGWVACCPAHDDKSPSVSIAVGDDGRLLLHCFAGCSVVQVLDALGLSLSDLFPEKISPDTPDQRRELREKVFQANWRAALGVLYREASLVYLAACELHVGTYLDQPDINRLALAISRINAAREVLR